MRKIKNSITDKNEAFSCSVNLFGATENYISDKIKGLIKKNEDVNFSFFSNLKKVSITLTSLKKEKLEKVKKEISKLLDPYIYSYDNQAIEQVVGDLLIKDNLTLYSSAISLSVSPLFTIYEII